MNRKFKITIIRGASQAAHLTIYQDNERPQLVKSTGDTEAFICKDGSRVGFDNAHMDKLASSLQEQAEECGAEGVIEEVTGRRGFQIRLTGTDFNADLTVTYHPGNAVPVITSAGGNDDIPLPDGTRIPFSELGPDELKSFVSSMAKSNGLNFEFTDLYE